tara:strand:+ start:474 stop:698 length:225 start_codon:yes stop_codon:yes gene_type:complete
MSESSVINKIKDLRSDLDKETKLLKKQMELPLNSAIEKDKIKAHQSERLVKGIAFSKWIRKMTSQFESIDPFYK